MKDGNLLQRLQDMLSWKKSKAYYANRLGVSVEEVEVLLEELRTNEEKLEEFKSNFGFVQDLKTGNAQKTIESPEEIKSLEDLIKVAKIDVTVWDIDKWIQNYWGNADSPKWQVKIWLSPKKENIADKIGDFLSKYKSDYKPLTSSQILKNKNYHQNSCALISLTDFHLDKLAITKETTSKKVEAYTQVLENLLLRAYNSHYIEEIVFVLGSDFFHTDTFHNTTTKGTPVFVDMPWEDSYEVGFDLMVQSISRMKQFCDKLTVVLVPGNHSRLKEYYLAHALEVYFKEDSDITFKRSSSDRKVHTYGQTLMCFSHGNNINEKLPLVFATQFYEQWGKCRYKEIILGDKHHNSEKIIRASQNEANGVRMRILPSLSPTDQWHDDNLFVEAIQAGICIVYDKLKGKTSEFEERI